MTHNPISPFQLNNGVELPTRFVMAPMVAAASTYQGDVTQDDINYFLRRAATASILITGATNVGPYGNAFGYGLGAYSDEQIPGLRDLAQAMKSKGNQAILQIFHPGRQAKYTFKDQGIVYAPSAKDFDFLDYPVTEMSLEQVEAYIDCFAQATRRAIEAGFDGVEIHGANHYLIQQFFSSFSNERHDDYGGSLEKRAAFPLAVVKAVKAEVAKHDLPHFIIGYRISPEEVHGSTVGYSLDDSLYLIDQIADLGVDYIHVSLFGPEAYKARARAGKFQGKVINEMIGKVIGDRAAHMGAGDITSYEKAVDALNYLDLLAMGSAAILDPDMQEKIIQGKYDDIQLDISDHLEDLALPSRFYLMVNSLLSNQSVPQASIEAIKSMEKE